MTLAALNSEKLDDNSPALALDFIPALCHHHNYDALAYVRWKNVELFGRWTMEKT